MKENFRKGIVLAGGLGTRLLPLTKSISKQILPIYDKPMIYYSLSILMLARIKDILIISNEDNLPLYKKLLDDGSKLGIRISYECQYEPKGIADAFIIGEKFIGTNPVALILGDNMFYGQGITEKLLNANKNMQEACIFGCWVDDPSSYGNVEFNNKNELISIEEKPLKPKSNYAVTGLYFYPNSVVTIAKNLKPSLRGELEITDINNVYLNENNLKLNILGRGFTWFDTGSHDSLLDAANFVRSIEKNQGLKIACLEEISLNNKWIEIDTIKNNLNFKSSYSNYLTKLIEKYES